MVLLVVSVVAVMGAALRASGAGALDRPRASPSEPLPDEPPKGEPPAGAQAPGMAGPSARPDDSRAAGPAGAASAGALPTDAAQDSAARLRVRAQTVYYDVEGSTEADLLAQLRARGPRWEGEAFFGLTRAEYGFTHGYREHAGRCALAAPEVELRVTITLPRWQAPAGAAPALRQRWDRFAQALAAHEDEHRRIAEQGGERLRAALARVEAPACAGAGAEARRLAEAIGAETQRAHERYDAQTGHGRTEGAVWPRP
ncbi:MAG: DUF922 domain-containing protein [Rubricoccaceae bacterium]